MENEIIVIEKIAQFTLSGNITDDRNSLFELDDRFHKLIDSKVGMTNNELILFCDELIKAYEDFIGYYSYKKELSDDEVLGVFLRVSNYSEKRKTILEIIKFQERTFDDYLKIIDKVGEFSEKIISSIQKKL